MPERGRLRVSSGLVNCLMPSTHRALNLGPLGTLADQSLLIRRQVRLEGLESGHVEERRLRDLEEPRALRKG